MCGRFAQVGPVDYLIENLGIVADNVHFKPSYNVCPGENILCVIFNNGKLELKSFKWGLIPHWIKDKNKIKPLINARAETVYQKPSFSKAFKQFRCFIPANGFYEWANINGKKVPYYIKLKDKVWGFAGIYDYNKNFGMTMVTAAIITTESNDKLKIIHNRMPVILTIDNYKDWIKNNDIEKLIPLLKPCNGNIEYYKVSNIVNNPNNKDVECIMPI